MQRNLEIKDSENDNNFPENNFSAYLHTFQDPLKLNATLKFGFLFSFPGQNPNAVGGLRTPKRLTKFVHQPVDQQLKSIASQAWKGLSLPPVIPKNRLRPGVTVPIDTSGDQKFATGSSYQPKHFSTNHGENGAQESYGTNFSTYHEENANAISGDFFASHMPGLPPRQTAINNNGSNFRVNQQRHGALTPAVSVPSNSNLDLHPANVLNRSTSEKHISLKEDDDLDDLLQAIDLDQIVSEHYEKSCSQQTTQVKYIVENTTPPSVQSKVRGASKSVLKAESPGFYP